jgi:hypothetical protein
MKCVKRETKHGLRVMRVANRRAAKMIREGWQPCSKEEFKKHVRTEPQ